MPLGVAPGTATQLMGVGEKILSREESNDKAHLMGAEGSDMGGGGEGGAENAPHPQAR